MNFENPRSVFAIAVGRGREKTFNRFKSFAKKYAPSVDIVVHFDEKGEGCGTSRAYLFHKLKNDYDIIISMDDDIEITKGWYEEVLKAYQKFPDINLFTTKIMQNGSIYASGAKMVFDGNVITMIHNNICDKKYSKTDFAPGGCMIFCREALKKFNPIPIPICEDYEWYGQWIKLNLGKVMAINDAILVHNVKDNPRVGGFRSPQNILNSCKLVYRRHGWTFIGDENVPKYHCGLMGEVEIENFMREANRMIKKDETKEVEIVKKIKNKTKYIENMKKRKEILEILDDLTCDAGNKKKVKIPKVVKRAEQFPRNASNNEDITYLIPSASDKLLLDVCLGNIKRYTPAKVMVSSRGETDQWGVAFKWLFENCPTDIGIFLDDDAFLLRDITPLIGLVRSGRYSLIGFTYKSKLHTDYQYFQPNFLIMNIKKFKDEFGIDGINVNFGLAKKELGEDGAVMFMYGISQKLRDRKNKDLTFKPSKHYKFAGVLYDDNIPYILHLWYGSWKRRRSPEGDMTERDKMVSDDFLNDRLKI